MKQNNMKSEYKHPQTAIFMIESDGFIAGSGFKLDKSGQVGYSKNSETEEQFTRKNNGIGNGLWEDMK